MALPDPQARARRAARLDALLVLGALALLAGAEAAARAGRVVAATPAVVRLDRPEDAVVQWRRSGVRGRTLLLAARHVAMSDDSGPLGPDNYVYSAVREGLVRRVFHAIPAADWVEVERNLSNAPGAARDGAGFRVVFEGVPVVVTPIGRLPAVGEPVLLDLEVDRFAPAEVAALLGRVARGEPPSDVVAWYGSRPPEGLEALRARAP